MNTLHTITVVGAFVATMTFASAASAAGAEDAQKQQPTSGSSEEVTGPVAKIDANTGALALRSRNGTLKMHFPPSSLSGVKQGGIITAWLAIAKAGADSTRAYDAPAGSGQHRMTGTVGRIDHQRGWLSVKTEGPELELRFPPQTVKGLKAGDSVAVDLAFTKAQ